MEEDDGTMEEENGSDIHWREGMRKSIKFNVYRVRIQRVAGCGPPLFGNAI